MGFSEKDKIVDENLIFLTVGGPQFPFLCKCQIIILKTPSSFIIKDKQEEKKGYIFRNGFNFKGKFWFFWMMDLENFESSFEKWKYANSLLKKSWVHWQANHGLSLTTHWNNKCVLETNLWVSHCLIRNALIWINSSKMKFDFLFIPVPQKFILTVGFLSLSALLAGQ